MNYAEATEYYNAIRNAQELDTIYWEIRSEHEGECAAFGDSWGGAVQSVEASRLVAQDAWDYVSRLESMFGLLKPEPSEPDFSVDLEDLPF